MTILPLYRYMLLMLSGACICWMLWHIDRPNSLKPAEIDQLLMQATFAQDLESLVLLKRAAESGQGEAQLAVAKSYLFKQQSQQAILWLTQASKQANPEAATVLGKLYFQGDAQTPQNYSTAKYWFEQAQLQHDPVAAYYLGLIYKNGYGTHIEHKQAVHYFQLAAQHRIPSAMFMLANAYQFGDGVKADLKQTLFWYKAAAELELPEAIQELAQIYRYGNAEIQADAIAYQQQVLEIGHSLKHPALVP